MTDQSGAIPEIDLVEALRLVETDDRQVTLVVNRAYFADLGHDDETQAQIVESLLVLTQNQLVILQEGLPDSRPIEMSDVAMFENSVSGLVVYLQPDADDAVIYVSPQFGAKCNPTTSLSDGLLHLTQIVMGILG